jgi:two-component system sensor histidine kinase/response regulator
LDRALLDHQLAELAEMLNRKNLKAEKCFTALRAHLGVGEWSGALSRLEQQIDRLDFAAARKTLEELAEFFCVPSKD